MTDPLKVHGADISHYQTSVDLAAAKKAGLRFLYHKASEGTTYVDANFVKRRTEARKAGLPFGAYHFARPGKIAYDGVVEARHFLSVAQVRPGDMLPVLDLEVRDNLTTKQLTEWTRAFVNEVKRQLKVYPIIYTPYNLNSDFGCMLWVARYNNTNAAPKVPSPWKRWDIWQFSNGKYGVPNSFPGLGHVDLDTKRKGLPLRDLRVPRPIKKTHTLRIVTQNVRSKPKMPKDDVIADIDITADQAGVICWQEIGPEYYDQALHRLEESGVWETYWGQGKVLDKPIEHGDNRDMPAYETPISWRRKIWEFVDGGKFIGCPAIGKMTHNRWVTWVVLKHKPTGALVIFVNSHQTSGAFNKKPLPTKKQRVAAWHEGYDKTRDFIGKLMETYPEAAVDWCGDFNATLRHAREEWGVLKIDGRPMDVRFPRAIDHHILIDGAKYKWDKVVEETLDGRNSDHRGRRIRANLIWQG